MSCKIEKNKFGRITKVLDNQGNPSKLFQQLFNIPVLSLMESINTYKNVYAKKVQNKVYYQIVGEQGASNMDSVDESTVRMDNLLVAKEMEQAGKSIAEIKLSTGWERNKADSKWRYEIPDTVENNVQVTFDSKNKSFTDENIAVIKLDDLYDSKDLYKAYPSLKETRVVFYNDDSIFDKSYGFVHNNIIFLNAKYFIDENNRYRTNLSDGSGRFTLQHELQHLIQNIEGFDSGTNASYQKKIIQDSLTHLRENNNIPREGEEGKFDNYLKNYLSKELNLLERLVTKLSSVETVASSLARNFYLSKAGEVEARNVELRMSLSEQERAEIPLSATQQVPYEKQFSGEPSATFNGYVSYKEAVKNTPIGEKIEVKIADVTVATITNSGAINDLIRQNIIEDARELQPDGKIIYKTQGEDLDIKLINAHIAKQVLGGVINKSGDIRVDQKQEIEVSKEFSENEKELGEVAALSILATDALESNTPAFGNGRIITEEIEIPSDNVLMSKLKGLLNQLGIKTMSLEAWQKRTGSNATPNALADITNKIVAFAKGEITQDQLTEETAHFIIEALDQEQIKPLLDLVHKTEEWKQYAQTYMEIYNDEQQVRREILGKVLKNGLQERAAQQETLQGQSVLDRIINFFNDFITRFRNLLTDTHVNQLQSFNDEIYDKLMAEELFNELSPEQFDGNKLVMFQAQVNDTTYQSIAKLLDKVTMIDKKTGSTHQVDLSKINVDELNEVSQLEAVAGIASVVKKQVTYLNQRGKKKTFLSTEESFAYNATAELGELLKNISAKLEDTKFSSYRNHKKKALESAKDAQEALTELEINLNREKEERFNELVNDLVEKNGLSEHQRDILLKELRSTERDTRLFYSMFGGIIHAQNPILNMLAKRISRMNKETEVEFSQNLNSLFSKLNSLGYKDEQVAKLLKGWAKGHNLFSAFDFDAYENAVAQEKLKAYKEVDPTSNITLEDIMEKEEEWKMKLPQEKLSDYRFLTNKYISDAGLRVDSLNDENRKKFKDKIDSLNMSLKTEKLIAEFKNKRSAVYRKGSQNNGYSEEDLQQLKEINADYQREADIYDQDGNIKKGLSVDENGVVSATVAKEQLDDDVITTLELNEYREALKELYAGNEKNVLASFFNQLSKLNTSEKKQDFISLNSRIFFTDAFWNTFDKNDSLASRLKEVGATELADKIEKTNRKLKNILKRNRDYNNPSQTNYSEMSGAEEREIKELSSSLEAYFREAKQFLPKKEYENVESVAITTVNRAYQKEVEKRGLVDFNERLDFIRKHITEDSNRAISRMMDKIERFEKGDEVPFGLTEEDILEDKNEAIIKYAETKLLPYFKETRPKGVSVEEIVQEMATAKTLEEFENATKKSEYISINPSFIFEDADVSDRLNEEFKNRIENNEPLINLEKFANKEFFSYFGIKNTGSFSVKDAVATKNQKEFEAWKALIEFQESAIDYVNMTGKHSKYQLPQYRRGSYARIQQIVKETSLEKIKEGFKDVFTYREDDPELGQGVDGEINQLYDKNNLTIPRTGFKKLEKADEVTDELLYSYMLMMREAIKYRKRTEAWSDVEAMEHFVKGKAYGDKEKEKSQTYKMFDDFKRYAIFGQRETFKLETDLFGLMSKKRNLTPAINFFQSYVRNNNLAYSILTPMTSFLQGSTNFIVETVLGDRINKDAARLASAEMPKLMTQAVGEQFNVRAKSKMNKLYQFVGIDSPSERFENSNYGRVARNLAIGKSGYVTHFMADAPLQAQTILTLLHDYRIVDGDIIDYNSWRRKNRSLTEKQAQTKWKEYQDNVLYKHLVEAKNEKGEDLGYLKPDATIEAIEGWENKLQQVRDRITLAKQEIDNQISEGDKGMVQRNALFSWTTLHKGWLVTSMTKRFKGRHMNMFNNMMEEGTYLGTFNYLAESLKGIKKDGFINSFRNQFKDYDGGYKLENNIIYDEMGQVLKTFATIEEAKEYFEQLKFDFSKMRQISVKRAGADFIITNLLAMLGLALSQMADDDEDDYAKEFMAYTAFRLATEVTSQSTGFPAQAFSFLESPTVGMSQLQNSIDVFDVFNGEEISRGTYRGYSKREAWFLKALPGIKEANKIYNIDRTRNSFEFFNRKNLKFTLAGQMMIE